jgi:D-xylose transport system permease protein
MNSTTQPAAVRVSADARAVSVPHGTDWRRFFALREMGVYYALILLIAVIAIFSSYLGRPNYLSVGNVTNVVYQASLVAIMACAMTVVLISGNFDLSVASVAALAGVLLIGNADAFGYWPAAAIALGAGMTIGLVNGAIVEFLGINAFIVTLGTMTSVRGLVLVYTDGRSLSVQQDSVIATMRAVESGQHNAFWFVLVGGVLLAAAGIYRAVGRLRAGLGWRPVAIGLTVAGLLLVILALLSGGTLKLRNPVIYMTLFIAVVWFILTFTVIGRRLYAVGGNPEAARLSGINVLRYKLLSFVLCSGTAAVAGILFASRLRSINPAALQGAELTVIAAAILGGTSLFGGAGSVIKTLAGALLLFTLTNGFNILNLGANWQGLIEGVVVVAAAAIYTVGGKKSAAR